MPKQTSTFLLGPILKASTTSHPAKVNTVISLLCVLWIASACSDGVLEPTDDATDAATESTSVTNDVNAANSATDNNTTASSTSEATSDTPDDASTASDTSTDGADETTNGTGESTDVATTDGSNNDEKNTGTIPGLWNITRGDDVQYFEARANGNVTAWDYRGDAFQNGQDCFVKNVAFFRYADGVVIDVFGEAIAADVNTIDRQVSFSNSEGNIDFPRADDIASIDFTICGGDSNNFGVMPGLWDVTLGDDVQYFEASINGNVSIWDYRGDPFNNGQDCFVKSSALFVTAGDLTMEVSGQGIVVNVNTTASKVTFSDSDGTVDFPRVIGITSSEFNAC